jgi:RimJ/RimL family protein N-acetyltransferase
LPVCDEAYTWGIGWDNRLPYAPRPMIAKRIEDPAELASLFLADREAHVYGLADLDEPYWSHSSWFRDGEAAVGLVSLGGEWVTGYAISRVAPQAVLATLHEVVGQMPSGTWVTGPMGMHASISPGRDTRSIGPHWRMILDDLADVPGWEAAVRLGPDDLAAIEDLYQSDPGKAFFMPSMLENHPFVGVWEEDRLVAAAGTHVASETYGVAAVGAVITRPSHRGRGLGKAVVASLCHRLVPDFETIGLNVEAFNPPALTVYDQLGFRRAFQYEEIEVL